MPSTLQEAQNAVVTTLFGEINHLIEGANDDIQNFLNALAGEALEAAATGQADVLKDVEELVRVIGEKNRIRLVAGEERMFMAGVRIALGVAGKLVIPTIPTL